MAEVLDTTPAASPAAAAPAATAPAAPATATPPAAVVPPATAAPAQVPPGEPAKAPAAPAVPEKYELKLPDGSPLPPEHVERIAAFAKEQGLSQAQAQRLLDRENQGALEAKTGYEKARQKQSEDWYNELQNDKEFGGEAFKENAETAFRVVERFGGDSFRKELVDAGYGNHPGLLRFLAKIGKAMGEDKLVPSGGQSAGQKPSPADVLYGGGK